MSVLVLAWFSDRGGMRIQFADFSADILYDRARLGFERFTQDLGGIFSYDDAFARIT